MYISEFLHSEINRMVSFCNLFIERSDPWICRMGVLHNWPLVHQHHLSFQTKTNVHRHWRRDTGRVSWVTWQRRRHTATSSDCGSLQWNMRHVEVLQRWVLPPPAALCCHWSLPRTVWTPADITHDGWLVGWLVFNGTFSTKRLYRAMQKLKVC